MRMGLSTAFKPGELRLRWMWRVVAYDQWSEHQQLKQEAMGLIPSGFPGVFSLPAGLVMWMK